MVDAEDPRLRGHPYSIVPLAEHHVSAIVAIIDRSRREYGVDQRVESVIEPSDLDLVGTYSHRRSCYFVALHGDTVVGGAGISPLASHELTICELQRMYLDIRHRRHGAGHQLLLSCLQAAQTFGYQQCYAETIQPMQQAIRFYESHGFRQLAAPIGDTGHSHNDCWLIRDLSDKLSPGRP